MRETELGGLSVLAGNWPLKSNLPLLLFVHGAGGSRLLWLAQVRGLANVANTVALDLPGHGRSPGPGRSDIPAYAAAVRELIQAVGLRQTVLCGLSMGGAIVQQLLVEGSGGLAGAVLVSTGARLRVLPEVLAAIQGDFPAYLKMMGDFLPAPHTAPAMVEAVIKEAALCPADVTLGDFMACNGFDLREQLAQVSCPVLVVQGAQDRLTPPKYGEFLSERIPAARLVSIEGAGHIVPVEKPVALNEAMRQFIKELPQAPVP